MPVFNFTGDLQFFTVPGNVCAVRIRAQGAQGGNYNGEFGFISGGLGASIHGDFSVAPDETLSILVGGAGIDNDTSGAGGGGGSFVWRGTGFGALNESSLLIAAGGGGGAGSDSILGQGEPGRISQNGGNGKSGAGVAPGLGGTGGTVLTGGVGGFFGLDGGNGGDGFGAGGGGGGGSFDDGGGAGGAGISGNGGNGGNALFGIGSGFGGMAITLGGSGGSGGIGDPVGLNDGSAGGFGGGGGGGGDIGSNDDGGGGGGGGFTGGGGGGAGGGTATGRSGGGGGGSSFNRGRNQINLSGVRAGNGIVEIILLNDPCLECIRVPKIFDWTLSQTQDQREITPPAECEQAIANAIAAGHLVTVTCTAPSIDLTNSLSVSHFPNLYPANKICCLEIGREDVTLVDGTQAQLVAMVSSIPLHFVVSSNGNVVCEFDTHVKIFQKEVLCAP